MQSYKTLLYILAISSLQLCNIQLYRYCQNTFIGFKRLQYYLNEPILIQFGLIGFRLYVRHD